MLNTCDDCGTSNFEYLTDGMCDSCVKKELVSSRAQITNLTAERDALQEKVEEREYSIGEFKKDRIEADDLLKLKSEQIEHLLAQLQAEQLKTKELQEKLDNASK